MKTGDRAAIIFFGLVAVGCAIALFIPAVHEGKASRGALGLLGMPAWAMVTAGLSRSRARASTLARRAFARKMIEIVPSAPSTRSV